MKPKKPNAHNSCAKTNIPDSLLDPLLISTLKQGGIAVIPTDTIYGIVGRAHNPETVQNIRTLKNRGPDQAFIILCADILQVRSFDIPKDVLNEAERHWPGSVSIIMDTKTKWPGISGNLEGIAFRIPNHPELLELLSQTGPLVAPSANPNGKQPASSVTEAFDYFGNSVDAYVDHGKISDVKPSKLIKIRPNQPPEIIRP